jgi:hypothetical protein
MSNNPYVQTRILLSLTHERMMQWVRDILIQAGFSSVKVFGQFAEEESDGAHIVVMPYEIGQWPKLQEPEEPILLLGEGPERPIEGVDPRWVSLGVTLTPALRELFARKMPGRPVMIPPKIPVNDLPTHLRAWYESQGEVEGVNSWLVHDEAGGPAARLPSLRWQRGILIKTSYLVMASEDPMPEDMTRAALVPFNVPSLGAILVGIQMHRSFLVRVPAGTMGPDALSFASALAKDLGQGPQADKLNDLVERISAPHDLRVAIRPLPNIQDEAFSNMMLSMKKPMQPVINMSVRVPVGGGPYFEPAVSPLFINTLKAPPGARFADPLTEP